ncbi:unnamed protein product [Lactuca saligna]|uniref:Uncharacterized protein n=1 Tax=Lactuca saligna TaxID=75948 RepID=A0AA35V8X8_LACSI|nr:unnamed protein product [Lactuca saligna]
MKGRLDSKLHLTFYLLNPYSHYKDSELQHDPNIMDAILEIFDTLIFGELEIQRQFMTIDLPKYKEKVDRFGLELAYKSCMVNNADFDLVRWWGLFDEVDPKSIMESTDEALGTNDNQAPRQNSTTRQLFDEDFESENVEQVFEEGEYESDGVQILEEVGGD